MIKVHTLPGGLRVVIEALPFVRSVSFGIWVRNGSRHESAKQGGITHFIEHMLFKGTTKRSAFAIADDMDAVGGQLNAFTSKEYTCYYARTLDSHFDVSLDVLTDMFFNSRFDEAEINKERNVILEEISMYEDTPEDLVMDLLQQQTFVNHPLGLPILGKPETIGHFEREDFVQYMKHHYCPANTVIAVAGNIDEDAVLEKISAAFAAFNSNQDRPEETTVTYTPGFSAREKDIEQIHLCVGFPGLPTGRDEAYALAALSTIFGGGMSSRLFQKIREERGLAYSVYAHNTSFADTGLFMIYAALNPAQLQDVLGVITEEVQRMFTQRVTEEQLAKTREQLKSNYLLSLESAANRMNSIGRTLLLIDKIITPDELIQKIDAIGLEQFYDVCERIFQLDQMSLSLVGKGAEDFTPHHPKGY